MRNAVLLLVLLPAVVLAGYLFLAPGILSDYRWIIIALPILLAFVRELYDPSRNTRPKARHQLIQVAIEPLDDRVHTDNEDPADQDMESIDGLWTGTLSIWPLRADDVLQVLPLQISITDEGRNASVILPDDLRGDVRVVEAHVLEYAPRDENLDIRLVIDEGGKHRDIEVGLTLAGNRLAPGDDTGGITAELQRATTTALVA